MSFGYLYVRCENGKILNEWNVELDKNKKDLFCDNDNVLENFKSCKRPRFKNVVVLNGNNVEYERSNAKFAARCYGDKTSKNFMVQCVGDEWVFVFDEGVFGEEEMTKHCEMATSQNVLN
ncbi:hypothetical protein MHBO_002889 [Bonamia ostreae]|uniref:Uncharacterized protein n=1 Tax=Bonamia ostreae TaxID=126728 RepID=A0ABV2APA5_9EUKA